MTLFHLLIVLAVLAGVAAVAAGKVTGGLPEPTSTRPDIELVTDEPGDAGSVGSVGTVGTKDVDEIRFSVGFRGYRMDEVDDVLDRLGLELGAREEEIRELREQLAGGPERVVATSSTAEPEVDDDPDLPPAG